jgi:YbgC/YbaW family acyl-CoA thioester hydrolase
VAEGPGRFVHPVQPTFYQADPAGVLFYGRIFELFHQAYAALVVRAGVPYQRHFGIGEYATPIVHAEADYRRPIRPGETLEVRLTVERLGESSITLAFEIVDAGGDIRATGREVHVTVDAHTFGTRPMPAELRAALEPYVAATARRE